MWFLLCLFRWLATDMMPHTTLPMPRRGAVFIQKYHSEAPPLFRKVVVRQKCLQKYKKFGIIRWQIFSSICKKYIQTKIHLCLSAKSTNIILQRIRTSPVTLQLSVMLNTNYIQMTHVYNTLSCTYIAYLQLSLRGYLLPLPY